MHRKNRVLLVNPWITDFAAHDLWMKPLGLLYIASCLKECGYQIHFVDCLARWEKKDEFGKGKFFRKEIPSPEPIAHIPRPYYRYGITLEEFNKQLGGFNPDFILISSGMTYWYPGLQETISLLKKHFPGIPIILGGRYVTLCKRHAQAYSGADYFIEGEGELPIVKLLAEMRSSQEDFKSTPCTRAGQGINPLTLSPSYEYLSFFDSIALLTSRGCPFNCSFCAVTSLFRAFRQRDPEDVVEEICTYYEKYGVINFAFYDDALLFNPERHIKKILRLVIEKGLEVNFHTPNGLNPQFIDGELASLMFAAGFKTIRLSLESSSYGRRKLIGKELREEEFMQALNNLVRSGYKESEIEVYLIMGLPNQGLEEVYQSLIFVNKCGARSKIASYSPIPNTEEWTRAVEVRPELVEEPLLSNNSIFPVWAKSYPYQEIQEIKNFCNNLNIKLRKTS